MKTHGKSEDELLKDVLSGKYRNAYLVYNRKSTDDVLNQQNSLKYQREENLRFAERLGLSIAPVTLTGFSTDGIISERHSAFKEDSELIFSDGGTVQFRVDRPKFYRLVELLSKGYFRGVVALCWDRASRNKSDEAIIRKLMRSGVDVRFVMAQYEKTSSGELHMDVDGMFSVHHSRNTREKVTLATRSSRGKGLVTHKAPVGYLNEGNIHHKPHDPERAPIVRQLFDMAATGEWSLSDLARWATEQGFTMPPMRRRRTQEEILAEEGDDIRLEIEAVCRPATANSIHKILTNRFYTGRTFGPDGEWVTSHSHEALVSDEKFDEVQRQLRSKRKSAHYAEVLDHPLRGMVFCGTCGRVYTPYPKKGIMYYGARCDKSCVNPTKSFNYDFISDKVGALMAHLSFTEDELAEIDTRASTDIALLETKRMKQLESNERRKRKIREDLAYLNTNRLTFLKTGAYTPELLASEEVRLTTELAALRNDEESSDISMQETVKDVIRLSELLKNAAPYYSHATPSERDEIIRVIFSELVLSDNTLQYKCKKGFQSLESRFVAVCDLTGNRTPI